MRIKSVKETSEYLETLKRLLFIVTFSWIWLSCYQVDVIQDFGWNKYIFYIQMYNMSIANFNIMLCRSVIICVPSVHCNLWWKPEQITIHLFFKISCLLSYSGNMILCKVKITYLIIVTLILNRISQMTKF